MSKEIHFYNRYTQQLEEESVAGDRWLRWTYGSILGRFALWAIIRHLFLSRLFGWLTRISFSKRWVTGFVEKYAVPMSEYQVPVEGYSTFDAFFTRKLMLDARVVDELESSVIFPADGRHLLFERIHEAQDFFIKGQALDLEALVDNKKFYRRYCEGALVISRLCPVDYHRIHFPVAGMPGTTRVVPGDLYSVNPLALSNIDAVLWRNLRAITEIETKSNGIVLMIEVGATFVGRIVQTYEVAEPVSKGSEKGYFTFGGSTVITLFEPGSVSFAEDLRQQSASGVELYAKMGDVMASLND